MTRTPEFRLSASSPFLDALVRDIDPNIFPGRPDIFVTQNEEIYYLLSEPIRIKSFPIHHDLRHDQPYETYKQVIESTFSQVIPQIPNVFEGTQWRFEARDPFHPSFFQVFDCNGRSYVFLIRFDLSLRPRLSTVLSKGTNDMTADFETHYLFVTPEILPLDTTLSTDDKLFVLWLFNSTWIGEKGRGYYLQGIWMDDSITQLVSRLISPPGTSLHPFFPIKCRYQSLSATLLFPTPIARKSVVTNLDTVLSALNGRFIEVQENLRNLDDAKALKLEDELRGQHLLKLQTMLPIFASPQINTWNMKEYRVYESPY